MIEVWKEEEKSWTYLQILSYVYRVIIELSFFQR